MNKYLNTGVKQVIIEFPQIGKILEDGGIGCVTCSVGTCMLKDVIGIHGLTKAQESALMTKIEKVIYPEREVSECPEFEPTENATQKEIKYSPPVKRLVEEHDRIKRLLAVIPSINKQLLEGKSFEKQDIEDSMYYIRNYADRFHHAKEEDILFKYTDGEQDIIKAMLSDHVDGRSYVKGIANGLQSMDVNAITTNLANYRELLTNHIKREDEILYPWFDRNLTVRQVGELSTEFSQVDEKLGNDITSRFEEFLNKMESKYF